MIGIGRSFVQRVVVVGGRSQVGGFLHKRLAAAGIESWSVGREVGRGRVHVFLPDVEAFDPPLAGADAVITLAPLPAVADAVRMAGVLGARHVIALGSVGKFSKRNSSSPLERDFALQQESAEMDLARMAQERGMHWTLLRPTMIYGAGSDQNISFIRAMVKRFGFFPIPIGARGLRQPVHADDIAAACVSVMTCTAALNRAYDLGGGERLEYADMVRRIFWTENRRALIVPVPKSLYAGALLAVRILPEASFLRWEMVERMYSDLIVDNAPSQRDFGFVPRGFVPDA